MGALTIDRSQTSLVCADGPYKPKNYGSLIWDEQGAGKFVGTSTCEELTRLPLMYVDN
jgi:hypothetical protein